MLHFDFDPDQKLVVAVGVLAEVDVDQTSQPMVSLAVREKDSMHMEYLVTYKTFDNWDVGSDPLVSC